MKLIDVDKITDDEIIYYLGSKYASCLDDVRNLLNDQPTAYNLEAVVMELEDQVKLHARHQLKCEEKGMIFCADRHEHKVQALDEAISIVRRGGRNE